MSILQGVLALGLACALILAYIVSWRASHIRRWAGLPPGEVVYADMQHWEKCEPLRSPRYGLIGKPDYIMRCGRVMIPVEVKPGRRAVEPYDADVMQLAAYCLLLEETTGQRPPFGLLRYQEQTFRIPYDQSLRHTLLRTLRAMRRDMIRRDVPRSHDDPWRCRFCGQGERCAQRLAIDDESFAVD